MCKSEKKNLGKRQVLNEREKQSCSPADDVGGCVLLWRCFLPLCPVRLCISTFSSHPAAGWVGISLLPRASSVPTARLPIDSFLPCLPSRSATNIILGKTEVSTSEDFVSLTVVLLSEGREFMSKGLYLHQWPLLLHSGPQERYGRELDCPYLGPWPSITFAAPGHKLITRWQDDREKPGVLALHSELSAVWANRRLCSRQTRSSACKEQILAFVDHKYKGNHVGQAFYPSMPMEMKWS